MWLTTKKTLCIYFKAHNVCYFLSVFKVLAFLSSTADNIMLCCTLQPSADMKLKRIKH